MRLVHSAWSQFVSGQRHALSSVRTQRGFRWDGKVMIGDFGKYFLTNGVRTEGPGARRARVREGSRGIPALGGDRGWMSQAPLPSLTACDPGGLN